MSFFTAPATTEISTLSLHDALPILVDTMARRLELAEKLGATPVAAADAPAELGDETAGRGVDVVIDAAGRSEEHTSELQSHSDLVCRLLLEKKKNRTDTERGFIARK